jgi:broad specificity phosphatase PhoE
LPDSIIFVRHGQTADNIANRLSSATPGAALSVRGIDQACVLAELLGKRELAAIYASPLRRAMQTASVIAEGRSLPVIVDDGLREMSCGANEGRNDPGVYQHLDYVWRAWTDGGDLTEKAGPEGESAQEILDRSTTSLARICRDYPGGTVLVVTHSGIISLLIPHICRNLEAGFGYAEWIGNCELVEIEPYRDTYKCISWAARVVPGTSR